MPKNPNSVSRRAFFASAASVGAVAVGAVAVPAIRTTEVAAEPKTMPSRGGGYSLSEHVKRYYKTTLV